MDPKNTTYFAYLLRLWRENNHKTPVWRASLEDIESGEQIKFANADALFNYLQEKMIVKFEKSNDEYFG